jgi:hypothetical protein
MSAFGRPRISGYNVAGAYPSTADEILGPGESLRRHADDRERKPVHAKGLSDDRWIAREAPLPVGVTQHDDRLARRDLLWGEDPPDFGLHAQHREVVVGDEIHQPSLRLARAGTQAERFGGERRDVREDTAQRAHLDVVAVRRRPRELRPRLHRTDDDQPLGVTHRHWAEQVVADKREDRRVGADTECQRRDRDYRPPGTAPQGTEGERHVLSQTVDERGT